MGEVIAAALVAMFAVSGAAVPVDRPVTLGACEFEDSRNCYWDADKRGNGEGMDFVNIEGQVYRWAD